MTVQFDPGQPVKATVGSLEPSDLWIVGLPLDDDGALLEPRGHQPSYWADCECPDDCLRDHENE
jgi:hypothetical protein